MHDGNGQGTVGAGAQDEAEIGLGHGGGLVDVDDDHPGAAFPAGAHGVGHDIDLGMDRIGAPDDDAIALGHLLGIDAAQHAGAGDIAGPGGAGAAGVILAGITLGGAQAINAVALHLAQGAGVEIGPDCFGAVLGLDLGEAGGDFVERVIPGDRRELTAAFGAGAAQRLGQSIGVVHPLGIAGDLFADDAGGIGVILSAAYPANGAIIENVDVERAG